MNGGLSRNRAGCNFVCKEREKCAEIDFFGAVWYNKSNRGAIGLPRLNHNYHSQREVHYESRLQ